MIFNFAYLKTFINQDPRILYLNYFKEIDNSDVKIGIMSHINEKFLLPEISLINNKLISQKLNWSNGEQIKNMDFIVLYENLGSKNEELKKKLDHYLLKNNFRLEKTFRNQLSFAGIHFDYSDFPHDLSYTLPVIYLFKRLT